MIRALLYLSGSIVLTILGQGVAAEAYVATDGSAGGKVLWLLFPELLMFYCVFVANDFVYIPHILKKGRYTAYGLTVWLSFYLISIVNITAQQKVGRLIGTELPEVDVFSAGSLVQTLGFSIVYTLVFFGLGLGRLYRRSVQECEKERSISEKLEGYRRAVSELLPADEVRMGLERISNIARESAEEADREISRFSQYLRHQLYELPAPPKVEYGSEGNIVFSRIAEMIAGGRYHRMRHVMLLLLLMAISSGALFETPGHADLSPGAIMQAGMMFVFLCVVIYPNILVVFPFFSKRKRMKAYLSSICVLLSGIVVFCTLLSIQFIKSGQAGNLLYLAALATGSIVTLVMLVAGTSSLLLLQNHLRTQRRLTLLRAETMRQEYNFLRKQINPHFIFNVLNSISVIVYDSATEAEMRLSQMECIFEYQLSKDGKHWTSLGEEVLFLQSYLGLAESRGRRLRYTIKVENGIRDIKIPVMLFIPFVENAVKYANYQGEWAYIEVKFGVEGESLVFECCNNIKSETKTEKAYSGIGLRNTLRRLDLIYDGKYRYKVTKTARDYVVRLSIPVNNQQI